MNELSDVIADSNRIVFFGGAGVSTESGIPDFRSGGGLYDRGSGMEYPPEEVLSLSFFRTHPEEFFSYYRANLLYPSATPNPAHRALAALERLGKLTAVITQNIDGLHQAAGSQKVMELHGNVHRNHCMTCQRRYGLDAVLTSTGIPRCECGGVIKPDVVLYEESLNPAVMAQAASYLSDADLLIVGGTSLVVYPAAGLVQSFHGSKLVLINKTATTLDRLASMVIHQSIGEALSEALA